MSERTARPWGYWTRAKLAVLNDYLPAFLQAASGKSQEYVYLDAFAGEGRGVDRLTGEEFHGSSRIALEAKAKQCRRSLHPPALLRAGEQGTRA
jgi:three-Cys-motif partner protein